MFVSLCRIEMDDGRTRFVIDGPFDTPEEAVAAKASALEGTRYSVALTDSYHVEGGPEVLELIREQVVNVLTAYAPEP